MNNIINETFTKHLELLQQHLKPVMKEGKMNQLLMDLKELSEEDFKRKHGKTKSEIKAMLDMKEDVDEGLNLDYFTLTHLEKIKSRIRALSTLIYNDNTAVLPIEVKERLKTDLKNLLDGMLVMINKK